LVKDGFGQNSMGFGPGSEYGSIELFRLARALRRVPAARRSRIASPAQPRPATYKGTGGGPDEVAAPLTTGTADLGFSARECHAGVVKGFRCAKVLVVTPGGIAECRGAKEKTDF
jgi:hypothetical protein